MGSFIESLPERGGNGREGGREKGGDIN